MKKEIVLEAQLLKMDKQRADRRENMKAQMRKTAETKNSLSKIVFPKMHVPEGNVFLRRGLPWLYNGFLLYLPEMVMLVDPGVDVLYRLATSGIDPSIINTIFISHGHLDHVGGANVIGDWLLRAGQPYEVLTTKQVIEEREISRFHAGLVPHHSGWKPSHKSVILESHRSIITSHGGYELKPIPLHHGIECIGFIIFYDGRKISFISDTGYTKRFETNKGNYEAGVTEYSGEFDSISEKFDDVREAVKDSEILIINVETLRYNKNSNTHLTIYDVIDIAANNGIGSIIVSHVNPVGEVSARWPKMIAEYIQIKSGVETIAPSADGLEFRLQSRGV